MAGKPHSLRMTNFKTKDLEKYCCAKYSIDNKQKHNLKMVRNTTIKLNTMTRMAEAMVPTIRIRNMTMPIQ